VREYNDKECGSEKLLYVFLAKLSNTDKITDYIAARMSLTLGLQTDPPRRSSG
jgi:hypothetical protein